LTSTTTLGGKAGCAPASRLFVQASQALVEEPLPPFADDLTLQTEARGDDVVAQAVGGQQDDLRPNDVAIWRRILGRPLLKGRSFFAIERNGERASSRHASGSAATESVPSEAGRVQEKYVIVIEKQSTKVKDAHSHRFRDTFAVSLLEKGVSIENVSVLLGHASVRITERHYKPWVKTLQKKLEDEVRKAWN